MRQDGGGGRFGIYSRKVCDGLFFGIAKIMYRASRIGILGFIWLLVACASDPNADLPESKTFQFLQADIERENVTESFSRHLTNANDGTVVTVNDGTLGKVRLGEKYYSAIGHLCRHFKSLERDEADHVACLINESWRKGRAIMSNLPAS